MLERVRHCCCTTPQCCQAQGCSFQLQSWTLGPLHAWVCCVERPCWSCATCRPRCPQRQNCQSPAACEQCNVRQVCTVCNQGAAGLCPRCRFSTRASCFERRTRLRAFALRFEQKCVINIAICQSRQHLIWLSRNINDNDRCCKPRSTICNYAQTTYPGRLCSGHY